jgi:serine/threonine protein kinase
MTDDATLRETATSSLALDATRAAPVSGAQAPGSPGAQPQAQGALFAPPRAPVRSTVLPRVAPDGPRGVALSLDARTRYEPSKVLGAGGMGEVVLVSDHDIGRKVAVKRLLPELKDQATLARFVDEIRTVGRLEHPNIVPIHDVGVDEAGRYFFVMKYVEGETLEGVIEKLAAGEPGYLARYSVEVRIEIFLGLLHALEYAHAQGVVHRDIKPANVMVGRFGEVVLMDWGIAKPIAEERDAAALAEGALGSAGQEGAARQTEPRARLHATRIGSLIGTPAYMSPEQASGGKVDARSDLYSAMVLFHELLGLEHYLASKQTLEAMLHGIKSEELGFASLISMPNRPPAELLHVLAKGLQKDPARRFQSAAELIGLLQSILEGKVPVQCHMTFTKRSFREMGRLADRAPWVAFASLIGLAAAVLFSIGMLVRLTFR